MKVQATIEYDTKTGIFTLEDMEADLTYSDETPEDDVQATVNGVFYTLVYCLPILPGVHA